MSEPIVLSGPEPISPIERTIACCLEAREAMGQIADPFLQTLMDMLLLELGSRLAADLHPSVPDAFRS
ncbi:hypothetical protein F6X53_22040 [Methylobacterium soli]|uniref:Uncharacterized protein n=1 Tax=Methylobacterium soli TaxID=553447 RepID=A0A6L3ST58_9HYPH|nr:hypothetical protein F6X53_22040 [Methylobacterium soli]GJE45167.1 hypothetical protein AEGHOMDF_4361 [Methylobacterium soli]